MSLYKPTRFISVWDRAFRYVKSKSVCRYLSKASYDHRLADTPLRYDTYCDILDSAVEKFPERPAITSCHQGIKKTYQEFYKDVIDLAAGFLSLGLPKGSSVALLSPNNYEWVTAQYALANAGFVLATINPAYTESEICYAINKSKSAAVILAESFKNTKYMNTMRNIIPNLDELDRSTIKSEKLPTLKHIITMSKFHPKCAISLDELADLGRSMELKSKLEGIRKSILADDPVMIQFTSGTTGSPKGAVLNHHSLINNSDWMVRAFKFTEKDALCLPVPLFHCFGSVLGGIMFGVSRSKLVLPAPGFSAIETLKSIDTEKCTAIYGSPTIFTDMIDHPDFEKFDYTSLRGGVMAASTCPMKLLQAIHDKMNMRDVCVAYGTTENSPMVTMTDVSDSLEIRCSTVGRTIGHAETKIIDSEGKVTERGQIGELCSRGYQVMLGYLDDEAKTKEAIGNDRWYKTGDLATMDDEGYIKIVGRIKDMIIRGGENIYPKEVEDVLLRHPSVAEVQVFGVPNQRLGEIVCSWIRTKSGHKIAEDEVKAFCSGKLAKYKIPLHIRFVNDFPKVESGKIKKSSMTEAMVKELNL